MIHFLITPKHFPPLMKVFNPAKTVVLFQLYLSQSGKIYFQIEVLINIHKIAMERRNTYLEPSQPAATPCILYLFRFVLCY